MRIVIKGTPTVFHKIVAADIPGTDLENSYFEYCDFSDRNLSAYNLRGVTVYRCIGKRVRFPTDWLQMEDFYSRCHYAGGDPRPYLNAVIPKNRPAAAQHDLVVEILFQRADKVTATNAATIRAVALNLQDYVNGCYATGVAVALQRLGTLAKIKTLFGPVFVAYPKLARGLLEEIKRVGG